MARSSSRGRFRLSLAARIFLLVVSLLGLALGAAFLVTYRQGNRIAAEAVKRALDASAAAQTEFVDKRLADLQLKVQLIANDASFVRYIAESQGGLALGEQMAAADASSIRDLLDERMESYEFSLGMLLDGEGNLMARTDQTEALAQSFAEDAFVKSALETLSPISGFWRQQSKVYQAAVWPLALDEDLIGFLVLALEVDNELGMQVHQFSEADIAYLLPSQQGIVIAGSSLGKKRRELLGEVLASDAEGIASALRKGVSLDRVDLSIEGKNFVGRLSLLDESGGPEVGSKLQFASSDAAVAGYNAIVNTMALAGGLALIVALPLSLLLAKATLRPLTAMAKAAKEAAAGSYQARFSMEGNDELADLSQAFDSLLSDLRGERDIEAYVSNLSRLMPDPGEEQRLPANAGAFGGGGASPVDPQRVKALLLAVEGGHLHRESHSLGAAATVDSLNDWAVGLADALASCNGDLLAATGPHLVFGFAGDDALRSSLQGLRAVWRHDADVACALIEGEFVHGGLSIGGAVQPVLLGTVIQQLERLLCDSAAGHALLPKATGEAAKALLGEASLQVAKGALSGKSFYDLRPDGLAALPDLDADAGPVRADQIPEAADGQATVVKPVTATSGTGGTQRRQRVGDLPPGSKLGGRYEVISVLGTGGMGVVYKARDRELDDIVAIKMLKGEALGNRETIESLKVEMKLARKITHPNVLRTFDFGEINGMPYISMEYVRGMTLRYLLKQTERIPFTAGLRIARQLSAGLHAAHEVGVLHRDIKPENLILEASGNAKLMDFGIARPSRKGVHKESEVGMYVGTPRYSPPEQLAGEDVDQRADIFATGVMLQEMFCGRLPFSGSSTIEIYTSQLQAPPALPREHWPDVPPELEAIILRCIELKPSNRFATAAALGEALAKLRA